jgi:hypothetical protein
MLNGLRLIRIAGLVAVALAALVAVGGQAFAQSVTSVSTNPFSYSGGQTVTITGSGFFCGGVSSCVSSVTIGGGAATNINVTGDTTLTATTPADSSPPSSPTVSAFPSGITPDVGPTSGGTGVTINGTGFGQAVDVVVTTTGGSGTGSGLFVYNDVEQVSIGGTNASSVTFVNPTQLTASTPPGVTGVGNVIVSTAGGNTGSTGNNEFAYTQGGPSISAILPDSGLTNTASNPQITISGSNFVSGTFADSNTDTATKVTFGCNGVTGPANPVSVTNVSSGTAAVPNCGTAGAVTVTVKLPDGSSASYNYLYVAAQTPIVTGITNINSGSPFDGSAKGSTEGGDQVTITGSYFTGASAVTIGGTAVSAFTVQDSGHITTSTPPGTAGAVYVAVTVPQASPSIGTSSTAIFTYVPPVPQVTSVLPNFGGTAGGTSITIRGSGFTYATKVSFGSNSINCPASCTIASDNEIDVSATPAASGAGTVDVTVTNTLNQVSGTSSLDQFTYIALPTVTGLNPTSGPAAGGNSVTITGTNFSNASTVKFGSVAATVTSFAGAPTQLTATAPTGAAGSAVDVQVSIQATLPSSSTPGTFYSAAVSADKYTYQGPPNVNSVSPNAGSTAGGYDVKVNGSSFTGATQVAIGGTTLSCPSQCTVSSDTVIDVPSMPAGTAGTASVVVTTPNGSNAANTLFTYYLPPSITTIAPTSGPVGTSVTITGTNFGGRVTVAFGSNQATTFSVNSATSITAIAPPGTGTVFVTVTTPGGSVNGGPFTYTVPPTISITSPAPPQGPKGTSVVITASAGVLTGATAVQFGGVNATSFTVNSSTQITATAPPGTGMVSVTVTTPSGTATTTNQFTYLGVPTVTSISPPSGPPGGNYQVTISGTSLAGVSAVNFGNTPATNFTYSSATQQVTATVPAGTGTVNVTVTTPLGTSAINSGDQFTYTTLPAVTGISPTSGPSTGGTSVTITGNNFGGVTAVKFGGTAGTITASGPTTIVATSPPGSGTVDVTVTTTAGTSAASSADRFTYIPPAPTITGFTPNSGSTAGGTSVTITGTNLSGATSVTFGTTSAAITADSAGSITATSPPGTGAVTLTVTTPGGTVTSTGKFTYTAPAPTVTSVSPNIGPVAGSATVTINGTNFTGVSAVKFGSINATSYQYDSPTQITAVTPAGSPGAVDVTVTTSAGTSAINQPADQYTYSGTPAVTGISPNTGSSGTSVTITGSNFTGATAVNFGSTPGTSVSVNGSGTSITVLAPPGSGTVNVTVVTPNGTSATSALDRFTYKATTSLTLTSSPNPSSYGQPVTFTALVTGNAPTGTVTFAEGGTTLGSAPLRNVTATSATAVFTISTLAVGADLVTASYGGDANNASDPQTVTQYVNAPADSVKLRLLQIAAMSVESNTSAQAITGAIDSAIAAGFSGTCAIAPTPNGSGFTYCFDGEQPPQNAPPAQQARARIDDGFAALSYADGLPGTRWSEPQDLRLAGDLTPYAMKPAAVPYQQPREWLAWVDVRASEVDRTGITDDLHGLQGNAMFGLTRRFSPNFLIGVTGGYENFDYKSDAYNGVLRGQGFTGGAYLGWRLGQNLRFEAAGTWSDIFVNDSAGAASGQFTGQRWLAFGNLTGNFGLLGATLEPSAQVYTLWEHENAYTDSLGTLQATHDFDTGRASDGLKMSHAFSLGDTKVVPYLGLYGDYYFTMDNANGAPGLTPVPLMQGWAARANGGITAALANGAQVSVGGELSGIGNTTQIWTVNVRGSVPF